MKLLFQGLELEQGLPFTGLSHLFGSNLSGETADGKKTEHRRKGKNTEWVGGEARKI